MTDRTLADMLALRLRLASSALRWGFEIDPDGEVAVARRLRLWMLGALVFWIEVGMWWFGASGLVRLSVIATALLMVATVRGLRRMRETNTLPYLYHSYATDILLLLADRTDLPLHPWEVRTNRMIVEHLHPGTQSGRLTPEHAASVVAIMTSSNMRTAMILHAHLRMMLEAETLRNLRLLPILRRVREDAARSRRAPVMGERERDEAIAIAARIAVGADERG